MKYINETVLFSLGFLCVKTWTVWKTEWRECLAWGKFSSSVFYRLHDPGGLSSALAVLSLPPMSSPTPSYLLNALCDGSMWGLWLERNATGRWIYRSLLGDTCPSMSCSTWCYVTVGFHGGDLFLSVSLSLQSQKSWIESTFTKRECVYILPVSKDPHRYIYTHLKTWNLKRTSTFRTVSYRGPVPCFWS